MGTWGNLVILVCGVVAVGCGGKDSTPAGADLGSDLAEMEAGADACQPNCCGKECGDDGCGGECGECTVGDECTDAGTCHCVPKCVGRECGSDGAGGSCGSCPCFSCDQTCVICNPETFQCEQCEKDCAWIFECFGTCQDGDQACYQNCVNQAPLEAQMQYNSLMQCTGGPCYYFDSCGDVLEDCRSVAASAAAHLAVLAGPVKVAGDVRSSVGRAVFERVPGPVALELPVLQHERQKSGASGHWIVQSDPLFASGGTA